MKLTLRLRAYHQAHQTPHTAGEAKGGLVANLVVAAEAREQLREAQTSIPISQIPNTSTAVDRAGGKSRGGRGGRGARGTEA